MKSPVLSVGCNTSTLDAFQLMVEKNISGLAVTDEEDGTLVHNVRFVCMHARMHVCIHTRENARMYVCMHTRKREREERERESATHFTTDTLYLPCPRTSAHFQFP
jgi:CBS domain-containing protein